MAAPIVKRVCRFDLRLRELWLQYRCPLRYYSTEANEKSGKFAQCPRRVFSGIQPTGIPHIGNYVGAIRNWLDLQEKYDSIILSIVDLHSITVPQNPVTLRENIYNMTACLLACGIEPEKCILFQQSTVPEHTQLAWILGCLCKLPWLQHLPQWKEKSARPGEVGVGLFTYPILQAADILLYRSTLVPVGNDQLQHIELARDLAKAFNRIYDVYFPCPEPLLGTVPKIKSLRHPEKKMSKSELSELGYINIIDTPDMIVEKIKKAKTDFQSSLSFDPENRPGVSNLLSIHESLTDELIEDICESANLQSLTTGEYKMKLADIVIEKFKPIRDRYVQLQKDRSYLNTVLQNGQLKASEIATNTYSHVVKLVGIK